MNKKAQSVFLEVVIAIAIAITGLYTIYYAIVHHDMRCDISGTHPGYWCVFGLIFVGIVFVILGIYGLNMMLRGSGGAGG